MRLRAITTGINTRLGAPEIASILERTRPRVVVRDVDLDAVRAAYAYDPPVDLPRVERDVAVAIVWTSGTTGMPKGAVFDHRNLRAVAVGAGAMGARYDVRLAPLPFAHVAFMSRPWEEIDKCDYTVITPTPWSAVDALRLMVRERVTVGQGYRRSGGSCSTIPTSRTATSHPFGSREPARRRCARARAGDGAEARLSVVIGYTSTEAAITTGTVPGDTPEVISQTVGRARVNVELEIVDDDGRGCPSGAVGRVRCRSEAVMRGYWQDPDRTSEVLGTDGWLTTGDLGRFDERGYLTLVGRRSEMYIRREAAMSASTLVDLAQTSTEARRHDETIGRLVVGQRGLAEGRHDRPKASGRSSAASRWYDEGDADLAEHGTRVAPNHRDVRDRVVLRTGTRSTSPGTRVATADVHLAPPADEVR